MQAKSKNEIAVKTCIYIKVESREKLTFTGKVTKIWQMHIFPALSLDRVNLHVLLKRHTG